MPYSNFEPIHVKFGIPWESKLHKPLLETMYVRCEKPGSCRSAFATLGCVGSACQLLEAIYAQCHHTFSATCISILWSDSTYDPV
jgi:hypothetical protein